MSTSILAFPKGSTHVRITCPNGKHSIVTKDDAPIALIGVEGVLTYLVKTGKKGAKDEYSAFAGNPVPNPLAKSVKVKPEPDAKKASEAEPESAPEKKAR